MKKVRLPRNTGLIFQALPRDQKVRVDVGTDGRPIYIWPNMYSLPREINKAISSKALRFIYPPKKSLLFEQIPWIINLCGDADEYEVALTMLAKNFSHVPIFNHPDRIMRTRRDRAASILNGIEGLCVPRCVRFSPYKLSDFVDIFENNGFDYPVLVRPAGSQSSRGVIKVEGVSDWKECHDVPKSGNVYYMTQFVDFVSENILGEPIYAKARVNFCGDKVHFRHLLMHERWQVNFRKQIGDSSEQREAEYEAIMRIMKNKTYCNMVEQVRKRIGLDGFILDFGWNFAKGRAVFFEVSAAAQLDYSELKSPYQGPGSEWFNSICEQADVDLLQLLQTPSKWLMGVSHSNGMPLANR